MKIPGRRSKRKTDEELISAFIESGNLEVLGELYSEYMHLVYGVCLKYLKDREDSMDAVMQIFEKLIIEIPHSGIENFRNWLYVVTKNYCLMQLRSRKSGDERMKEWMNESSVFMESSSVPHPIDEDEPDLQNRLEECIERLKDEQKECIMKFYYGKMCYSDIAAGMGLDEKKVKSHLQNAKRNLKLCLEEKHV